MKINDELKKRRNLQGLTQKQLAEKAGVGLSTLRDFERGARSPSFDTVEKLSGALGAEVVVVDKSPQLRRARGWAEGVRGRPA